MEFKILDAWLEQQIIVDGVVTITKEESAIPTTFDCFFNWMCQDNKYSIKIYDSHWYSDSSQGFHATYTMTIKSAKQHILCNLKYDFNDDQWEMFGFIYAFKKNYEAKLPPKVYDGMMKMFYPNEHYLDDIKNKVKIQEFEEQLFETLEVISGFTTWHLLSPQEITIYQVLPLYIIEREQRYFTYSANSASSDHIRQFLSNVLLNKKTTINLLKTEINAIAHMHTYVIRVINIDISLTANDTDSSLTLKFKVECIESQNYYSTFGHHEHRLKLLREYPSVEGLRIIGEELNVNIESLEYVQSLDKISEVLNGLSYSDVRDI